MIFGRRLSRQAAGSRSQATSWLLQKEMYEVDSDTEGYVQGVYIEPDASPAVSIASDDNTDSTKESDGEYDSDHSPDVDMHMEDDVDAPYGVDLNRNVDMERDDDDEEEEDEEEEDGEEEDEEEEDKEEEEDEDDGKEPWTIGQREMLNTPANAVDTMVDDQPTGLEEQGQEMNEHTPMLRPLAPVSRPHTLECCPPPETPETYPLSRLKLLGLGTTRKPRLVVPTLREAEETRNTSDVVMDHQLLSETAGGDSLPDVPHPDDPLPDDSIPEARMDCQIR